MSNDLELNQEDIESYLIRQCYDSSLNVRIPVLKKLEVVLKSEDVDHEKLELIFKILLKTYLFYGDSASKNLVLSIFGVIMEKRNQFCELFLKFILVSCSQKVGVKAIADYQNLLDWLNFQTGFISTQTEDFQNYAPLIAQAYTHLINCIEVSLDNQETTKKNSVEMQNQHRRRIRQSTLQLTTKTFVQLFKNNSENEQDYLKIFLDTALEKTALSKLPSSGVIVLMGALTKTILQLSHSHPSLYSTFKNDYIEKYTAWIGTEVIAGKNQPSPFCIEIASFKFVNEFVDQKLFEKQLTPQLEKAMLRSPEITLGLLRELYKQINSDKVDLLKLHVSSKLMTQTFSSLKNSKENVRVAALEVILALLATISPKNTSADTSDLFIKEIMKNIKANLNADYKSLASQILIEFPFISEQVSLEVVQGLSVYIAKESNEMALKFLLDAFFSHYFNLQASDEKLSVTIKNGLNEKKLPVRKIWLTSFMMNAKINKLSTETIGLYSDIILTFLNDQISHFANNDHSFLLACFNYLNLLNSSEDSTSVDNVKEILKKLINENLLGDSLLQITLSNVLNLDDRRKAVELLRDFFQKYPEMVGIAIVDELAKTLDLENIGQEKKISFKFVSDIFKSISAPIGNTDILSQLLIRQLFVSQSSRFRLKNGWAGQVMKAKMDPAHLIDRYSSDITTNLESVLSKKNSTKTELGRCALKGAVHAAFINPNAIAPKLTKIIEKSLSIDQLRTFNNDDFEIAQGEEGQLVIDVLDTSDKVQDKNLKDFETLEWEAKIRKEQANKSTRKLSKEEQVLVDEQLAKESTIRNKIDCLRAKVSFGLSLIKQLSHDAELVDNGINYWYPVAVSNLLTLTREKNSDLLVSKDAVDAFLSLSKNITSRLGNLNYFIGIAILRTQKVQNISTNYLAEPVQDLLSRILFKIKFTSDQQPLDSTSLTYILPLLINVLEEGKIVAIKNADKPVSRSDFVEEDKEEEHLLLAIEIIAVHAEAFEEPSIPRAPILKVLLSLLTLASKAKIARECFNALSSSISVAPTDEDFKLLLSSLMSPNEFIRSTVLEALDNDFELESYMNYSIEIFVLQFDSNESNRDVAKFIWEFSKFTVSNEMLEKMLQYFQQSDSGLRLFVAQAFVHAVQILQKDDLANLNTGLDLLMLYYDEKSKPLENIVDEYGLVIVSAFDRKDPWEERSTAAIAFKTLSKIIPKDGETVVQIVTYLIQSGALGDSNTLVRQEMKEAGIELISQHGASYVEELIPIFETALTVQAEAAVQENIIILYGSLARHLESSDSRVETIITRLLGMLETPSQDVQQAVSECLSPLVFLFRPKVSDYINDLMKKLLTSENSLDVRKGAAWGIAGLVKGYGISALSEFDIVRNLIEASEDKKEMKKRESVAFAFEYLSKSLGKFFEPYVIEVLPNILKNLGDSVTEVRDATTEATKAIMAHTTSFGVKKLIPVAVSNLDEISWRTKRGSVELLGNMAYLDPTQLSSSLSTIVPEIVAVLNDSHKEVRKSADESLKRFGEVIRNPEIQKLVPTLIKAIGDPTKHTEEALDSLIHTQFVHYIDGPSLALIIHVIHRGMHDRSANTKRKACKIVGNMAILVDTKDLIPYLQQLMDEVEIAMVDPVPNTRATAARALGALVEKLGEEQFPTLIPRLIETLQDESKAGDRLGSAQALAEVISGLGVSKLDELLPTILEGATNYRSSIREGFMPLLLFIPICFGAQFAPYINQIIQPILAGLADNDESIRDTALKAGKLIVKNYATKAIDLLLPELERGLFDENDRIRLSSVQLTGDLLFQVTGISAKNEFSEEEGDHTGEITKKITNVLGAERRDKVLAALFVCRNDVSGIVRASTVDIWKSLVPNTPRTIKEILPSITSLVVTHLASSSKVLRNIAAQTLSDLVRRVGGNAMSQLLPTLEKSLDDSTDANSRQGVSVALTALVEPSSAESIAEYEDTIVNIIRKTLIDEDESVRQAAALTFDVYQNIVGKAAVDNILPYLLNILKSEKQSSYALAGLQDIMSTKSEVIFPVLIPTLLASPIDAFRASALGSLAEVAGSALYKRLSTIVNALIEELISDDVDTDFKSKQAVESSLERVLLSVTSDEGLHPLFQQIMSLLKHENIKKHIAILERLPTFFEKTPLDYDIYTVDLVSNCILSLNDDNERIVKGNFDTLTVLVKKQEKSMLEKLVRPSKQSLHLTGVQGQDLAAFALPKGPNCILPIFLQGLMYGSNDDREASALAIADIVSKTPAANLKPYVSVMTGPLIRVVGERFNSNIKAAILFALNILFAKIPQFLRPFIPQLQRTFVKSLSDATNETLRLRAAKALGTLIEYQPRVDPLVVELVTGAKQATDEGVKTAMLKALLEVVTKAGSKMGEPSKNSIVTLIEEEMLSSNDKLAVAYAKLIGALSEVLNTNEAHTILNEKILNASSSGDSEKFGILTLNSFLRDAPVHIFETQLLDKFIHYIVDAIKSPDVYFCQNGLAAAAKLLLLNKEKKSPFSKVPAAEPFIINPELVKLIIESICSKTYHNDDNSVDSRRFSLVIIRTLARFKFDDCIKPYLSLIGGCVFSCVRDMVIPVKLAAEKAYLAIFNLLEEENMETFTTWLHDASSAYGETIDVAGVAIQFRSISDYTKRVGKRLANVERERIAEGGDAETMFSDRFEDEKEIWAVGDVEIEKDI